MRKLKIYRNVRFSPDVIETATKTLESFFDANHDRTVCLWCRQVNTETEGIWYNTDEEFFARSRNDFLSSIYDKGFMNSFNIRIENGLRDATVTVNASEIRQVEAVFEVFENNLAKCKLSPIQPMQKPNIFIGHGRSAQWKDLKDHLHEKHKYDVVAYETGARAGHEIRDILEEMLDKASFAVLVLTGEDETEDGKMRARQNVIHELGLFQGRLGFKKAIVLMEESTEEFSNLQGVQQIRYGKENIKETFGEVLATIRREFG